MNRDLDLLIAFLAPIKALLLDDSVTEIMGNPDGSWWYGRAGRIHSAEDVTFEARSLHTSLEVIANQLGKKLDNINPLLNAQLPDGSRLAAVLPPVVKPFPSVTIRKFSAVRYTVSNLVERGAMPVAIAEFLRDQIQAGRTMLISGGTDSGKTTVLNALTDFIPEDERIVVIEDTRELRIAKPNVLAAECQTDAHSGSVDFDDLLKASLRWRPDRIILGEIRREGARTLLDSFNTGHAGSMATIHASSARQALRRFCDLAMRSHQQSTRDDIAEEIGESVQLVVQTQRFRATRRISEIILVRGYDRVLKGFAIDSFYDVAHEPNSASVDNPHAA